MEAESRQSDTAIPATAPATESPVSALYGRLAAIPEALEPLGKPFYAVAFLLIFLPGLDFWGTVAPTQWGEVRWRFGALGIFSGFLLTPLFGSVLLMAMAAMMEHKRVQALTAILNLGIALVILTAFALFALDALQIRAQLPQDGKRAFDFVALRTLAKLFIGAMLFSWLALAGRRSYLKTKLPEGWQPGDPVPIVNTETVNLEGLSTESAATELRSDMVLRHDEVHSALPAAAARKSEELLLRPSQPNLPVIQKEKEGISRDMIIRNEDVPVENAPPQRPSGGVTKDMLIVKGDEKK